MDPYNKDRARTPSEEEEDDDEEEHEQLRLVETPDPVNFSRMDNGKSVQAVDHIYGDTVVTIDGTHFSKSQNFASFQYQNDFYLHYIRSKEMKESSKKSDLSLNKIWKHKDHCSVFQWILSIIPILSWLPKYNWKTDLAFDAVAGFTVAVMHIPQGMAYAMLSNVDPIVGLYMAFYPVIMYSLMGTSRHISIGTFAIVCLMTGKVASEKATYYSVTYEGNGFENVSHLINRTTVTVNISYSTNEIATAISLCVGFWQVIMGVLQLGSLSVLLSAELISGFTTGCAVHVLTSQMKNLLGLKMERRSGIFKIPLSYMDIAMGLKEVNTTAVILSLVTISILVIYNEFLKPLLSKRISFPIPVELITIIIGTLVSRFWITASAYGISIVNHIPTGFPNAAAPPLDIVPDILIESLIIAVVAYAISISMAKIFASKHHYEIRPNQEFLANGCSNIVGSFFSCAPIAASLSRSLIQEQVGGKTQLAGLFSCSILLFVLLWIGPFFETLPHCILSSLIVVALKGMFMQVTDLPNAWRQSRTNGAIWIVTFLTTALLDIEYGLVTGLIITLLNLLVKSNSLSISEIGHHHQSNLFVEKKLDSSLVAEIPGVKILKLTGNLNFATVDAFSATVNEFLNKSITQGRLKLPGKTSTKKDSFSSVNKYSTKPPIAALILDLSSLTSVDPAAIKRIRDLHDIHNKKGVRVLYASCPSVVLKMMDHCKFFKNVNIQYFYPSVEHAVVHYESVLRVNNGHERMITPDNNFNGYCLRN